MIISKELIDNLDYLCDKIGLAVDWSNQEILTYLEHVGKNYIKWEIASSVLWIIIMIIFVILLINIQSVCVKKLKVEKNNFFYSIIDLISICLLFLCICIFISQIFVILKCVTFPEKVIYDYISSLTPIEK